jgi:hypothetical protein
VTDPRRGGSEAPEIIREILRRAGHEIRNALSGAAVNVEVVRSRSGRKDAEQEIATFAARAAAQIGEASSLSDGLLALVGAILAAQKAGSLKTTSGHGAGSRIELMIYGQAAGIVSDIERLASRIGAGIEQNGQSVILTILPEGKSHSKA